MIVPPPATTRCLFDIHGIGLQYLATSPCLVEPIETLLRYFRRPALEDPSPLRIQFEALETCEDIPITVPSSARRLTSATGTAMRDRGPTAWQCDMWQNGRRLIADFHDAGLLVIDDAESAAHGYLVRPDTFHADTVEWYVHFALVELLKLRGLYTLHATALEKDGYGVLIPGYSGRGKTTLFLSLLRAGYRYLSDDTPFLGLNEKRVKIHAFPMKVDVTDPTISFFPELRDAPAGVLKPGVHKKYFFVEDLYPSGIGNSCEPALILFPQVVDAPKSTLEPLPKSRALHMLLPQALVVYEQEAARREFQALTALIQQADCYTLHFGRNVLELPDLVTPLLKARR